MLVGFDQFLPFALIKPGVGKLTVHRVNGKVGFLLFERLAISSG